jgi:hypothetical protein
VPECMAAEICRGKGADCSVCLGLSVEKWREHAEKVLACSDP